VEALRAETVFVRHYDRLARIAYLVAPAVPGRQSRLVRAHRLVHQALPWRGRTSLTYPQMVARVVRRAARSRRVGLPVLVTWAWHTPVDGGPEHHRLDAALAAAEPGTRAAYVLTMVEHLAARDAVVLLQQAGWADAVAQVATASALRQRIHEEYGIHPEHQRHLLAAPPADPTLSRLRAPDPLMVRAHRVSRAFAVLAVVAAVAAAAVIVR
jgi:hypothetical protein